MNKNIDLAAIKTILSDWALGLKSSLHCSQVYLFGSIINREGRHFIVSGALKSDVDVLVIFSKSASTASTRFEECLAIQKTIESLENKLTKELFSGEQKIPAEPMVSVLLATEFEVYNCIHKGFDPKIFTHSIFKEISTNEDKQPIALAEYVDNRYLMDNIEFFTVARLAQKIRNNYLQTNLLGFQRVELVDDPYDTLPKELLRAGAMLNYVFEEANKPEPNESLRADLEAGQDYILGLLKKKKTDSPAIEELEDKLSARNFGRAESPVLDPSDVLLTVEVLFDEVLREVVPSVRSVIDDLIRKGDI